MTKEPTLRERFHQTQTSTWHVSYDAKVASQSRQNYICQKEKEIDLYIYIYILKHDLFPVMPKLHCDQDKITYSKKKEKKWNLSYIHIHIHFGWWPKTSTLFLGTYRKCVD